MNKNNRWVKLSACIPWDELADAYYHSFNASTGRPANDATWFIGAVIIKHKLKFSDEETDAQIQLNPYLPCFCGFKDFSPFALSLFVAIRERLGMDVFEQLHQAIIDQVERYLTPNRPNTGITDTSPVIIESASMVVEPAEALTLNTEPEAISQKQQVLIIYQGRLLLDATVAGQAIRFPTDLSLLNESHEISEGLIDELYELSSLTRKPKTYHIIPHKGWVA